MPIHSARRAAAAVAFVLWLAPAGSRAAVRVVAESGGDFTSIQAALNASGPGDTVLVREKPTPYFEKIVFPASGSSGAGHLSLEAYPGESPVIDGTGVAGPNMVLIEDRSWVKIVGFEIRNNLGVNDGSGIRVLGAGSHIEIRDNVIHDIRGAHAMGITVYGTKASPLSDLVIDGNLIHDCDPAQSEALTLNGNVTDFAVTNNVVRDVDSIGIDFIGGETDIQPDPAKVARNGVCRGNTVIRARASYGGGFAGGIYVDGGRDIVVENNVVTESDLGIEIGAENGGIETTGVVVRNNVVHGNDKAGIVFGGFAAGAGRVRDCEFRNNTLYRNDTLGAGFGELWIQFAEDNVVRNNLLAATDQNLFVASYGGSVGNALDHNLYFAEDGAAAAVFVWNDTPYTGFEAYRSATGQDASSGFDDPEWIAPGAGDFHLGAQSPAVNAGDPATSVAVGETDLDGAARLSGPRIDVGADEVTCGDGVTNPGEECDDANPDDGDGCDSNCTFTGCGNGIVTAGENCDDGGTTAGDCCDAACQLEPAGSSCDDGDACTRPDECDGAGLCAGDFSPAGACKAPGRSLLTIRKGPLDSRDAITWKWLRGDATSLADLGDPIGGGTGFTLCVYDRTAGATSLALRAVMPAGRACGGRPCWRSLAGSGFAYKDPDLTPDGLAKATLKTGAAGKAKVILKGSGARLDAPDLPLAADPSVTVQLLADTGACFGATYAGATADNGDFQFKAKLP
jgi:cysteine-rich repeat protein